MTIIKLRGKTRSLEGVLMLGQGQQRDGMCFPLWFVQRTFLIAIFSQRQVLACFLQTRTMAASLTQMAMLKCGRTGIICPSFSSMDGDATLMKMLLFKPYSDGQLEPRKI